MTPMIIPVIHYADGDQALRNARRAFDAGCEGILLIHMEGMNRLLPASAAEIRRQWPDRLIGINHLGMDVADALEANIALGLDMTWTDEQPTHTSLDPWTEADGLHEKLTHAPGHVLFTGVAFKHQRYEPHPARSAFEAVRRGFIPTTSGPATGVAAEVETVMSIRQDLGPNAPLAIASGMTPENVGAFAPLLSHILVATGVSSSFHEFDETLLRAFVGNVRR